MPGKYKPIPDPELTVCNLTPAADCLKINDYLIKITLKEYGQTISGSIGKLKNPYSATNGFYLTEIRYYQGCSSTTPTDNTNKAIERFQIVLSSGTIPTVEFATSSKVVGDQSSTNIASFTITPGT